MSRPLPKWGLLALWLLGVHGVLAGERGAVSCEQLHWSDAVLAANPDIASACRGVFQKDDKLYALARIEVMQVQGDTRRFRTLRTDGSKGPRRSVKLPADFRIVLDGRAYRPSQLSAGQQLDIFLPEDRFALILSSDGAGVNATAAVTIE